MAEELVRVFWKTLPLNTFFFVLYTTLVIWLARKNGFQRIVSAKLLVAMAVKGATISAIALMVLSALAVPPLAKISKQWAAIVWLVLVMAGFFASWLICYRGLAGVSEKIQERWVAEVGIAGWHNVQRIIGVRRMVGIAVLIACIALIFPILRRTFENDYIVIASYGVFFVIAHYVWKAAGLGKKE